MRIGLDLQSVGRGRTGDETYYRNLVSQYATQRPEDDFYLYYTHPKAEAFFRGLPDRFHPRKLTFQSPFLRVPFAYTWQMRRESVDLFHSQYVGFAPAKARLVLTIHDLSYELYPELFPRNRALFLKLTRWSARQADAIITVSENTKKDLIRLYHLPEHKIHVIYNAAHPRFRPNPDADRLRQLKSKLGIRTSYLLSVGSLQPRKNIARLVKAYLQARTQKTLDHALVIVGANAWGQPEWETLARSSPYASDIHFTGYLSDDDLPVLYSGASLFVYPSLYEGFGLPVLEAMACGTPVITSNVSSLPEVGGSAACYVDPYDTEAIAQAMTKVCQDAGYQKHLKKSGLERSALFSWERSAQETFAVYEATLRGSALPSDKWCLEETHV